MFFGGSHLNPQAFDVELKINLHGKKFIFEGFLFIKFDSQQKISQSIYIFFFGKQISLTQYDTFFIHRVYESKISNKFLLNFFSIHFIFYFLLINVF